ncbi:MAG: sulfotransferase [Phycisphaerales bacterium]|nr:sulfotransferase [Phycisphaerales bacterium]
MINTRGVYVCGMSRSGTTLLTTILDSHPDIAMGYEMLPTGLGRVPDAIAQLADAIAAVGDDASACRTYLVEREHDSLGRFVKRCGRTNVAPSGLLDVLESYRGLGDPDLDSIAMRARLSMDIVLRKVVQESAQFGGFKINAPSVEAFDAVLPEGVFIYIVRDPRDVAASHESAGFDRTIEHITRAWVQYAERFLRFQSQHPERAIVVRYEDLVTQPEIELARLFAHLGIEQGDEARNFFASKASVHSAGHRNSDQLQRDFFTTSVARWMRDVPREQVDEIQAACAALMPTFGYIPHTLLPSIPTPARLATKHTARIARAKKFYRDEYGRLVLPHAEGRVNLTWFEAATEARDTDKDILILRHDVDHDIATAVRMAEWEHEHGLRATYCILHTAWYYGEYASRGMVHYQEMLDQCLYMQSLGHEINLHNNYIVQGLETGVEPRALMEAELYFLRSHGLQVPGSSTHGDGLCRKLDFRNYELFRESVYEERGGARTIRQRGHEVRLGDLPMAQLGLAYEAYDLPRDLYVTDSGGQLRCRKNTRGRAGQRRSQMDRPPAYANITGILTHPIWWDFERVAPEPRDLRDLIDNAELLPE